LCYNVAPDLRHLGLLSWAIFFVVDDWALVEHFVVRGKARLPYWHFATILVFNVIIALASYDICVELNRFTALTSLVAWQDWMFRGIMAAIYLSFLIGSTVLLFPHVRPRQAPAVSAG
jgi:hypothetical protein